MTRPAPWHVVPKVSCMAPSAPTSTQDAVPIDPGISTGWPKARYASGTSGRPAGNARVDRVPLELGDVVANVVDGSERFLLAENALEGLAREVRNALAIGPGEIGGGAHRAEV